MLQRYKNTKKQGDAGLGIAIGYFCENDYTVCVPLTDSQDYDLVIEGEDRLQKVQVKTTTYQRNGHFNVSLSIKGGNSKQNYIHRTGDQIIYDLLFLVTSSGDKYLIPKKNIRAKYAITLGENYDKYKI